MILKEPIIAYRAWCKPTIIHQKDHRRDHGDYLCITKETLLPIIYSNLFFAPHKIMEANCFCIHPSLPGAENPICTSPERQGCGIHAFKKLVDVYRFVQDYRRVNIVIGKIALWGQVAEHLYGFRAQWAYPTAFYSSYHKTLADSGMYMHYAQEKDIKFLADSWAVDVEKP